MIKFKASWLIGPVPLLREGRMSACTSSTSEEARTMVSSVSTTSALRVSNSSPRSSAAHANQHSRAR